MNRRTFLKTVPVATVLGGSISVLGQNQTLETITLVAPQKEGGTSVLAALQARQTNRNVLPDPLPAQVLSNLLWAAFGVNRDRGASERPGRTAASASNSQEIDLYVALPEGVYLYEAKSHSLTPVLAGDLRRRSGRRAAATAPVNLFFVADIAKYADAPFQEPGLRNSDVQKSYYYVGTGLIAGNVYLFAASQGLAAWFHNCDRDGMAEALQLRPEQRVLFSQTVGYPG